MANIYLLRYNNEFNRLVKRPYETIAEYLDKHEYEAFFSMNFIPNDGLNTSHILNTQPEIISPNYCLVEDTETGVFTRWFVGETIRTRGGQYRFSLKRDVLAEYYSETLNANAFITKGFVGAENPLIFNSEGIAVNQIKKAEIPLKDSTRAAWIVGYLAPNLASEGDVNVNVSYEQENIPDISEFEYMEYVGKELKGLVNNEKSYYVVSANTPGTYGYVRRYFNNKGNVPSFGEITNIFYEFRVTNKDVNQVANLSLDINPTIFATVLPDNITQSEYLDILSLKDKVYKDGNVYKKVTLTPRSEEQILDINANEANYPNITQAVRTALTNAGCELANIPSGYATVPMRIYYSSFTLTLEEVGSPITSAKVTFKSTIKKLKDAPYKMFCIPVTPVEAIVKVGNTSVITDKDRMLQIASSIATGLKTDTQGFIYDIQLLPYCPIESQFSVTSVPMRGIEYVGAGVEHVDYDIVKDNADNTIAFIFYCDRSSFTTNVTAIGSLDYPTLDINNPIEFKVKNETYMFRITSPNFANSDNFNYFKNYGINYFNVDCTYKPLTPYIKININFKGLYGADFNDQRGLILGGDYSLPVINDSWINYQIQNKNYANIFERETQNLEYKYRWNMASAVTGAMVGTAASGAIGSQLGFGAFGGIGGGITGGLDVISTAALHGEQMDYRRDIFNFNIQNIQALPQGLVKTSAFNYNSKIFPIVEIFGCTDTETELVRNKIKFSGMTINAIGKIADYLNPNDLTYIQGRIIRIQINEDSHIANAINQELSRGVYYE